MVQDTDRAREQLRANIVARLVQQGGFTRDEANEAFDLAQHAASEAQRVALEAVARASSGPIAIQAAIIMAGMLAVCGQHMEKSLADGARARGHDVREESI